jgi:iron complex outermembrane receptor protein
VTSFGAPADGSLDQVFRAKWISDLSVSHQSRMGLRLTLGADNLLNVYPDRQLQANSYFGMFPYSSISPFGFNGRYVYLRATWKY